MVHSVREMLEQGYVLGSVDSDEETLILEMVNDGTHMQVHLDRPATREVMASSLFDRLVASAASRSAGPGDVTAVGHVRP